MAIFGIIATIFVIGLVIYFLTQRRTPETTEKKEEETGDLPPETPEM